MGDVIIKDLTPFRPYTLGLSRRATEWVMFAVSLLMMCSVHAIQITHLRHHRFCLTPQDDEGLSAQGRWWQALALGPIYPVRQHSAGLRYAGIRQRAWIYAGLFGISLLVLAAFAFFKLPVLQFHIIVMLIGHCQTAFFTGWIMHHDSPADTPRTVRNPCIARMTFNMLFHLEHHLFPRVPTSRLATLAVRIDQSDPHQSRYRVVNWTITQ